MKPYTFLALGDAYTAGVSLFPAESFPYQAVQLLRHRYPDFNAPEILAGKGWTTRELTGQLEKIRFLSSYDFVSLQIGVNNQVRGDSTDEFSMQFESLLLNAVRLAANRTERVLVLSIPDWSATPYGAGHRVTHPDTDSVPTEIDQYNQRKKELCAQYGIHFMDITADLRKRHADTSLHSTDGLHPSGVIHMEWAARLFRFIDERLIAERHS